MDVSVRWKNTFTVWVTRRTHLQKHLQVMMHGNIFWGEIQVKKHTLVDNTPVLRRLKHDIVSKELCKDLHDEQELHHPIEGELIILIQCPAQIKVNSFKWQHIEDAVSKFAHQLFNDPVPL